MKVELILKTVREIEAYNKGVRNVHNYYEEDIKQNGNYVLFVSIAQIEVLYELFRKGVIYEI